MQEENIHQKALRKWITAGLNISEVSELNGDASYIFNNMIAKYTLSNDQYAISKAALRQLKTDNIDLKEIYFRRNFYGRKKDFMYEHAIPAAVIRSELLRGERTEEAVYKTLQLAGEVTLILREEDKILKAKKLNQKMPEGWSFGMEPNARYHEAGILISNQKLNVKGAIVR